MNITAVRSVSENPLVLSFIFYYPICLKTVNPCYTKTRSQQWEERHRVLAAAFSVTL